MGTGTSEAVVSGMMTTARAARVLREYNEWRRGDHAPCDPSYTPAEIGMAIDIAVEVLSKDCLVTDLESIVNEVLAMTRVTGRELVSANRCRKYTEPRAMIAWLARKYTYSTLADIGKRLNRHHASIINYIRSVDEWMKNPYLNKRVTNIIKSIQNELEK